MLNIKVSDTGAEIKCEGSALDISTEVSLVLAYIAQTLEQNARIPAEATIDAVASTAKDFREMGIQGTVTEPAVWCEVQ